MPNCRAVETLLSAARQLRCVGDSWTDQLAVGYGQRSSALRALITVTEQAQQPNVRTLGGIPADTPLGRWPTLQDRLDQGRNDTQNFYRDLREYIRTHEMPAEIRTESSEGNEWSWVNDHEDDQEPSAGEQWLTNRTWGRAIQIKQDHLRQQGVTGRAYAQALWEWKENLEAEARRLGEPLPFSPEIAGKEPYLGEVYRGDTRPSDGIFEGGFRPWSDKRAEGAIVPHDDRAGDRGDTADHIWTSKNPHVAADYSRGGEWHLYVVQDALNSVDMNNKFGPGYELSHSEEVVFRGGIPADKIKGEFTDPEDPSAGFIPNPAFKPYEPTPIRPPREDGD